VRVAVGPKDLANGTIEVARRDTLEKTTISNEEAVDHVYGLMEKIQQNIYDKALKSRESNSHEVDDYDEFKRIIENEGGFVYAHWDGTSETEELIKQETKATIRCITLDQKMEEGKCIKTGKPSTGRVVFAKAY